MGSRVGGKGGGERMASLLIREGEKKRRGLKSAARSQKVWKSAGIGKRGGKTKRV